MKRFILCLAMVLFFIHTGPGGTPEGYAQDSYQVTPFIEEVIYEKVL